tara:strand:- start:59219 stop:59554 length:336 start_codon:yes stop_codon:yes gene_type:complete
MKEISIFLDHVGDTPRMRILQYFIEGRDFDYILTDLLNAGVSWGTLNSQVPKLLSLGILITTRKIGRTTLYKINKDNFAAQQLITLYDHLIIQQLDQKEKRTKKVMIKQVS